MNTTATEYTDQHDPMYDTPEYLAYEAEMCQRHEEGRDYPIGEMLECYECAGFRADRVGVLRECVALGPVTNSADPTQTYKLECGHIAI